VDRDRLPQDVVGVGVERSARCAAADVLDAPTPRLPLRDPVPGGDDVPRFTGARSTAICRLRAARCVEVRRAPRRSTCSLVSGYSDIGRPE
jgi:hypothetical protein